jgi:hypothetical protein
MVESQRQGPEPRATQPAPLRGAFLEGVRLDENLERNKRAVVAFYDLTFNQRRPPRSN